MYRIFIPLTWKVNDKYRLFLSESLSQAYTRGLNIKTYKCMSRTLYNRINGTTYLRSQWGIKTAVQGDDDRNSPLDILMTLGTASNSPKLFTDLTIFPNEYVCTLIVFVLFKIKSNLSMGSKSAPSFTNMVPGNSLQ